MKPILTVEFSAKAGDIDFKEESVPIHSPEELFAFVAPGGGCEKIPDEVDEIQMVFLAPSHPNRKNPIADVPATLELGMVFFTGPLSEISQTIEQLIDKAGRGELSYSFLKVIGI
jgi:hypothetical protein